MSEDKRETHPAYAVAGFSRITGSSGKLFGSACATNTTIRLIVRRAHRTHGLSHDHIHGTADKIVLQKKLEFDAFLTHAITVAGINTLRNEPPSNRDDFFKLTEDSNS
jgi:hypothetical protein